MKCCERHCVVSLSKTLYLCLVLAQPRKTGKCPDMIEKNVVQDVKYQHKQTKEGSYIHAQPKAHLGF